MTHPVFYFLQYCEILEVQTQKMGLDIILRGEGVLPIVTSSPTGDLLDFGYVLEKDSASQHVKVGSLRLAWKSFF